MATQQFTLSRTSWTSVLSGPVTSAARIEACRGDMWLWEASAAPATANLGVRLKEEASELVTLADGDNLYARAINDVETIISVTG